MNKRHNFNYSPLFAMLFCALWATNALMADIISPDGRRPRRPGPGAPAPVPVKPPTPKEEKSGSLKAEAVTDDANAAETQDGTIYRTVSSANVRSQPDLDSEIYTSLEEGTQVSVIGEENGWYVVSIEGETGYISMELLAQGTAGSGRTSEESEAASDEDESYSEDYSEDEEESSDSEEYDGAEEYDDSEASEEEE